MKLQLYYMQFTLYSGCLWIGTCALVNAADVQSKASNIATYLIRQADHLQKTVQEAVGNQLQTKQQKAQKNRTLAIATTKVNNEEKYSVKIKALNQLFKKYIDFVFSDKNTLFNENSYTIIKDFERDIRNGIRTTLQLLPSESIARRKALTLLHTIYPIDMLRQINTINPEFKDEIPQLINNLNNDTKDDFEILDTGGNTSQNFGTASVISLKEDMPFLEKNYHLVSVEKKIADILAWPDTNRIEKIIALQLLAIYYNDFVASRMFVQESDVEVEISALKVALEYLGDKLPNHTLKEGRKIAYYMISNFGYIYPKNIKDYLKQGNGNILTGFCLNAPHVLREINGLKITGNETQERFDARQKVLMLRHSKMNKVCQLINKDPEISGPQNPVTTTAATVTHTTTTSAAEEEPATKKSEKVETGPAVVPSTVSTPESLTPLPSSSSSSTTAMLLPPRNTNTTSVVTPASTPEKKPDNIQPKRSWGSFIMSIPGKLMGGLWQGLSSVGNWLSSFFFTKR